MITAERVLSPQVFTINTPIAGNYPQGLFKYPYKEGSTVEEIFTQTLEWSPGVEKTFNTNTKYTAILTLEPLQTRHTFEGTTLNDINGLPTGGVEDISLEIKNRTLVLRIAFKATAGVNAAPQVLFNDDFDGDSLDTTKWEVCPEWDRQGRGSWRNDMVSLSNGLLHLKFRRDSALGAQKTNNKTLSDNWLRAGAVRTIKQNNGKPLFEHNFGYYEARIKFPVVSGTWGAFWLMSRTQRFTEHGGRFGTEIDIVESIFNEKGQYNAACHWGGYGSQGQNAGRDGLTLPVNIYDNEFHIFALDWSPAEYIFYVDGIAFWRSDGGPRFNNGGINQNPNYIKLSVEGAEWAGLLAAGFIEDEMLVDYVRVYNQPKI